MAEIIKVVAGRIGLGSLAAEVAPRGAKNLATTPSMPT